MAQKFYEGKDKVVIGQRGEFRELAICQKSKWRGSARCVASEFSQDGGKVGVHWLVHGTLLRCSPAHVRPMVEETGSNVPINPEAALRDLEEIHARSTTIPGHGQGDRPTRAYPGRPL